MQGLLGEQLDTELAGLKYRLEDSRKHPFGLLAESLGETVSLKRPSTLAAWAHSAEEPIVVIPGVPEQIPDSILE
jgi:hypothetical protein